jgi:hypothetical protein
MNIKTLTPSTLRAAARTAAELHQTRAEANHYEPGSDLWHMFNEAMREAEAEIHGLRRLLEEGVEA